MAFGAVKILDINGLSYLYTKLNNKIEDFQNDSKSVIDAAAAAANTAASRANSIVESADTTYATKEELTNAINGITSFNFSVVSDLPKTGKKGVIYLVANASGNQSSEQNGYDEYIWIDSKYEKIGSTTIDLSQYITSATAADTYLAKSTAEATYATKGEVTTVSDTLASHTHNYAGSSSAGGSATSAAKLDTATAGSTTTPVYFKDGKPTACDYTIAKSVPADAKFSDTTYNAATTTASGLMTKDMVTKLNGIAANANNYVHPGSGTNPHGTTKSDVGLGNVGNFKAVSTVASQGLTDTEKSNARANIGAGTSSLEIGTTSTTAAAGDHTHNYAGSSSAGGSATSAVKLATARTINISGAVSGSATFDGSADITISTVVESGTEAPTSLATGALYAVYE